MNYLLYFYILRRWLFKSTTETGGCDVGSVELGVDPFLPNVTVSLIVRLHKLQQEVTATIMLTCVNNTYITIILCWILDNFVTTLLELEKHDVVSLFTLLYTGMTAIMDTR